MHRLGVAPAHRQGILKWTQPQKDAIAELIAAYALHGVHFVADGNFVTSSKARGGPRIGHGRRQLLWFAVTRHPTRECLQPIATELVSAGRERLRPV
jgi:hypothetical protein